MADLLRGDRARRGDLPEPGRLFRLLGRDLRDGDRPLAVSIAVTLITLGLFSLIVNACMVWLADKITGSVDIRSFWICLFIALVISAGNAALLPKERRKAEKASSV